MVFFLSKSFSTDAFLYVIKTVKYKVGYIYADN
jgi:hypothetical protein